MKYISFSAQNERTSSAFLFPTAILFPSHSQSFRPQIFFPYLWVCSWSNRGQKIQHCKHSTRVNNDCIRALYGRGSCLEFHISYVFLRANRRCRNRMICVPAGQKTSHGYNTQLLRALHFSNSCKIVLAYRCYSLFLSLLSLRQTKCSSSQTCWVCFPKGSLERSQFLNYSWTWKCLPQVLHGLKNFRRWFYCFPLFILVAAAAHSNCSKRPTTAPVLWIHFSHLLFINNWLWNVLS